MGSVKNMLMLKDKIAFVTGASRGIGKAICMKFAKEGATVYAGVRDLDKNVDLFTSTTDFDGRIELVQLDVCDNNSIKECVLKIKKEQGRLDVLVNNAGVTFIERFEMMRDVSINEIYETNVFGLMDVTRMAIRLMKKSQTPSIINISSVMAGDSDVGQTAYASSKAAVENMTRTWTKEYSNQGFRINAIAPGNVDTDMFNIISEDELQKAIAKIGFGRIGKPDEIANVALFLASDMSSYVTGETIHVTGGLIL